MVQRGFSSFGTDVVGAQRTRQNEECTPHGVTASQQLASPGGGCRNGRVLYTSFRFLRRAIAQQQGGGTT
jgi:hypothetical protein